MADSGAPHLEEMCELFSLSQNVPETFFGTKFKLMKLSSNPFLSVFGSVFPPCSSFHFFCGIERRKAVVPLGLLGSVVPHTVPPFQTDRVTCPREAQARPICYFIFPPFLFRVRVRSTKIYISQPVIIYRLKPQHNFIQLNCITCSF